MSRSVDSLQTFLAWCSKVGVKYVLSVMHFHSFFPLLSPRCLSSLFSSMPPMPLGWRLRSRGCAVAQIPANRFAVWNCPVALSRTHALSDRLRTAVHSRCACWRHSRKVVDPSLLSHMPQQCASDRPIPLSLCEIVFPSRRRSAQ